MAPKRAQYLTYGEDDICAETRKFIEGAGVLLDVRDMSKHPLSEYELSTLIGHMEITHFLNPLSDSYEKFRLDKHLPSREDIIRLMAKDHTLIRRPIIRAARLITVGCDKRKISEMLQIGPDGQKLEDNSASNVSNRSRKPAHHRQSAQAGR
ncbi:MAG TPA: ArsC/Spx/MgsR family protein [Candidatus Deferrimicrobium sp.]|nr:ArsC/Spx/MgsR family protein [Candidatus Deferrimicrobium sp.]